MATYSDLNSVQNPSVGATILAAWGDQARDSIHSLAAPPTVHVAQVGTASIADTSDTVVAWDYERWDTHGMHDNASNNTRLTVPSGWAGHYQIGVGIRFQTNNVGRRRTALRVNGAAAVASTEDQAGWTGECALQYEATVDLAVGDYIELIVEQESGGYLDLVHDGYAAPEFWARWVRLPSSVAA